MPESPKRPGYTFRGWYRTFPGFHSSHEEKQTELTSTTIWDWNRDLTFTARWTPQKCTITWDGNGGKWQSLTEQTETNVNYGVVLGSLASFTNIPTRIGYTFLGWFTHPTQGIQVNKYTNLEAQKFGSQYKRTYYAHWELTQYTITFDEGYDQRISQVTQVYGYTLRVPELTRFGYTFVRWNPNVPSTTPAQDTTYTAIWTPNTHKVTFNANGGTGGWSRTMNYGAAIAPPNVTRTGYTFKGWDQEI